MEFREMIRKKKALSGEECIKLLESETRGVLSVIGDAGYPYGTPMNHFYNEDDGCIYFHCGNIGHRLDALKACDKVSFCVYDRGSTVEDDWALRVKSVVVFGRMEITDDIELIRDIVTKLSHKFTKDDEYIAKEIQVHGHRTLLLKLNVEHMSGKRVIES